MAAAIEGEGPSGNCFVDPYPGAQRGRAPRIQFHDLVRGNAQPLRICGIQSTDAPRAHSTGLENISIEHGHECVPLLAQLLASRGGGSEVQLAARLQHYAVNIGRCRGRDIPLLHVKRDAFRTALERITITASASRADCNDTALSHRVTCNLSRSIELLDHAVPIYPGSDRNARPAAEHAKGRQQRAV